ncbi:MAG: hypothetical protein RMI56_02575 [Sulfolobales archaeon]|nr:hypothetical protein [Sulfolobales archaeon]
MSVPASLLLPSYSLGYYFQLAALALGGIGSARDIVSLYNTTNYKNLTSKALDKIAIVKTGNRLNSYGTTDIANTLCSVLDEPRYMYNAVIDSDFPSNIFKLALDAKLITAGSSLSNKSMCHMAAVYVDLLSNNIIPQGSVKLPMLMRATVFGRTRGPSAVDLASTPASLNSVGLAILGALAAYLGSARVGGSRYEYYAVPDGSSKSLALYEVVLEVLGGVIGKGGISVPDAWRVFTDIGGVATDLATYLAVLVRLTESDNTVSKALALAKGRAFESLILIRLEASGNRPLVAWAGSVAVSESLVDISGKKLDRIFQDMYSLARIALKSSVKQFPKAVSLCVNSLATASIATTSDEAKSSLLSDCARSLSSLLDERNLNAAERTLIGRVLQNLR